ncbi:EsaB/YukD family protein [Actinosynnema sp. CS-041913]|uniref:EsaB/YukD family protein n=1 Tax=Actinosynnema sp. CS-041913 TaxID=3239917 RepID=UPI003D92B043
MTAHTRVTLVGSRRRIDVVLPSAEPLGVLLPEFLRMADEPHGSPPNSYQLVGTDGAALADDRSLHESGVPDGAVLRILRRLDVPSDAVVHDVADATTDDLGTRAWRWGPGARRWACTLIAVLAVTAACAVPAEAMSLPAPVALVFVAAGSLLARRGSRPVGVALVLAGGSVGIYLALEQIPLGFVAWMVVAAVVAGVTVVLGVVSDLGRGGVFGGLAGLVLLALWAGLVLLALPAGRAAAIVAAVAVLGLGALPRIAVVGSGLATLDDAVTGDRRVRRPAVSQALAAAHRGLVIATTATAAAAGAAGALLAAQPGRWATPLACLTAAALVLRLRAFPLLAEVAALLGATAVIGGALIRQWLLDQPDARIWGCAVLLGCAAVALLRMEYLPKEHVRARFRQLADRVEAAVVLAIVPVVIGEFGVYSRLLGTF